MSSAPSVRAEAVIDLGAIERNCARLFATAGDAALCAVVKADGYGHGAVESGRAALAGGATWLAVATAMEAAELRGELPEARLLVLGALTEDELGLALAADADVAIWSEEFLGLAGDGARSRGRAARVHVKYDTGMGRLGERDPRLVEALVDGAAQAEGVELTGLWTHFATADEPDSGFLAEQLERFVALATPLRDRHPGLMLHAANSAATLREPASRLDMVRCGVAVYGLDPFGVDPADHDLEPALELSSYVNSVKALESGASAGYGRTWRAREATSIGVLPVGYGDGVRRGLGNQADVLIDGVRYPLVGTVSMDNVTVDLGPRPRVEPGARATLIGKQGHERMLAEELARHLDTINYEITCGISARVPRRYVTSGP